jgi:hypothetical protein
MSVATAIEPSLFVITGLGPVIPLRRARPCVSKRDGRDKPGHDKWMRVVSGSMK